MSKLSQWGVIKQSTEVNQKRFCSKHFFGFSLANFLPQWVATISATSWFIFAPFSSLSWSFALGHHLDPTCLVYCHLILCTWLGSIEQLFYVLIGGRNTHCVRIIVPSPCTPLVKIQNLPLSEKGSVSPLTVAHGSVGI